MEREWKHGNLVLPVFKFSMYGSCIHPKLPFGYFTPNFNRLPERTNCDSTKINMPKKKKTIRHAAISEVINMV